VAKKTKQITSIEDLTPDPRNANKGTERGAVQLENSLRDYGAGRSILVDRHGVVIAGNKTLEQAASIGMEVQTVCTDGNKLVVVQREDLDLDADPRARELAIADNRVAQTDLDWDVDELKRELDEGVDLAKFWRDDELECMITEQEKVELKKLDAKEPPKMAWCLIGIPVVRYGEIAQQLESLANIKGLFLETTVSDVEAN
jgi:hypothetical protein